MTTELEVNIANTAKFIDFNPSDLVFQRPTPGSAHSFSAPTDTPLTSQRVRLIFSDQPGIFRDAPDTWTEFEVVVLGTIALNLREHDWVDIPQGRLEIRSVMSPLPYERRARGVVRRKIE